MKRGEVVLVRFPHPSGLRGKKRPAVIVQSDSYASAVSTLIVAEVTSNLTMVNDPACLFIDLNTPMAAMRGLSVTASLVACSIPWANRHEWARSGGLISHFFQYRPEPRPQFSCRILAWTSGLRFGVSFTD